jgi:Ca2+-binding RTX toxin-like protein
VGAASYNLDPLTGFAALGGYSEGLKNFESILIGNGDSYVYGNASNNNIKGGAGDDTIFGLANNDTIFGGAGADYLYGGSGDDTIQGGLGQDYLDGGDGDDLVDYTTFNNFGTYDLGAGTANLGVFTETMLSFERIKVGNGGSSITGTSGDNEIKGGDGADNINSGDGRDTIDGGAGNDTIQGGGGDDYIIGGLGQDTLDGGTGTDYVDYTTFSGAANYNLATGAAVLVGAFTETMLNFENITTGNGDSTVTGTSGDNSIFGGSGNDTIDGDAGNDTIYGGAGNDTIQGGLGIDYLNGGDGIDTADYTATVGLATYNLDPVNGLATLGGYTEVLKNFESIFTGNGNSAVYGNTSGNYLKGGAGDDTIVGLAGNDTILGGAGADYLYGGEDNDTIQGGLGQDYLDGGNGIDTADYTTFGGFGTYDLGAVTVGAGTAALTGAFTETMLNFENIRVGNGGSTVSGSAVNNEIFGGDGADNISGNAGNDKLYGGAGNDTIDGGIGNDTIQGGLGQDTLDGGADNDTVDYTTFNNFGTYNLQAGTANLGVFTETILNFENIKVGNGGSTVIGSTANNDVRGGDGADTIQGGAGNDKLYGGAGNDTIDGGDDDDTLYGDTGNDTITGGSGNDTIQGGLGQDTLDGGVGVDIVDYTTFSGNSIYDLQVGTANLGVFTETMLNFESILAGGGNDTITGSSVANKLIGGGGNDTIYGLAGNDIINGGDGNDTIQGGAGQDTLDGGAGIDTADYTTFNGNGTYSLGATGSANLGVGVFTETMLNFENIVTGAGDDTIYDSAANNNIVAGAGNDTVFSTGGYISGGNNDIIDGGDGIDTIVYDNNPYGGSIKANWFNLEDGSVQLFYVFGINNVDTILNFENISVANYQNIDFIYGSSADNLIVNGGSSENNDTIYGNAGNDTINGGQYTKVYGGAGNDILYGNNSAEFHYGSNSDLFQPPISSTNTLANLIGTDTIKDFSPNYDKIVLHQNTLTNITDAYGALKFAVVANNIAAETSAAAIVYSQATKTLFYNQNGTGVGFENGGAFAILDQPYFSLGQVLDSSNFIVEA